MAGILSPKQPSILAIPQMDQFLQPQQPVVGTAGGNSTQVPSFLSSAAAPPPGQQQQGQKKLVGQ